METKEMNFEEVESRISQIKDSLNTEGADLDALEKEVEELELRKAELKANAEKRAKIEAIVNEGECEVIEEVKTEITEERKTMTDLEVRSSAEYGMAFLNAIKTGKDEECRALLSTNATSGGVVPVPTFLETEIKNAWENCKIASLCKQSSYKGNVKIGFEVSSTGATVHAEGDNANDEEVLVWGSVELKAENIKKWITVSDEALEGTTIDTIGELYKEIAQRIVEKAEDIAIGKITSAGATTTTSNPAVPVHTANTISADTIVQAVSLLSGKARNLNIAMNRQTYPAFVAVAMASNYAVDVFDGLKDKIVFTDSLPAFSSASVGNTYVIIGDFGYGFQMNKPNGNDITIKVDDVSLSEKDLVKIVGRQYVGMGVVAPKSFVKIVK